MNSVIELDGVSKIYTLGSVDVPALRSITLKIKHGEFVAITGPSGSGKTTLMNMVGSLDLPTAGKIYLDGNDITKMSESDLAQLRGRKIGFVFQQFNLIPSLTALENVALPLVFQGVESGERNGRAKKILDAVGLHDKLYSKPMQLSGGQQQRVAIARALVVEPEVVLADEPTGNLDSKTGMEILSMLKKLNAQGKTVIIVTHDREVAKQAHRIVKIKDGLLEKN
ncbi:MAG: macrolide ABC transporter ATP-binding protein [Candidatus Sungbacteria bacterium RIFCSPHIGHO2_02_FULL_49_12]|uniref:Macrolide ABC transporter ATP-binding protein n=1 Tax=Candidatus Sungbacteria bacterium RIFCSPHIGHO2_02_FULL_49_12 TaxID=1802271 RepID=A0A1G2KPF4_9BACT|nr:MAG: macrolide ABC transporter ATP-binding protein [Candidatus Sungbacteria bacterium RIFCSPHIGHO2_02_FULL_49_12]HLD63010.1 ABC transporter ATP-binding protein [Candidatus Norongarragalinales archaeon]